MLRRILLIVGVLAVVGFAAFWLITMPKKLPASELAAGYQPNLANGEVIFNAGNCSTAGRIISNARIRSAFFAQPGNASPFRLRASRTRLDITILLCGPSRRACSAGEMRNSCIFM